MVSDGAIIGYKTWSKALWYDTSLTMDERGIAELISKQGANGVGCFASAATIGKLAHREPGGNCSSWAGSPNAQRAAEPPAAPWC